MLARRHSEAFTELSYASATDPRLKRWFIRSVEGLSDRRRFAAIYDLWRRNIVPTGDRIFGRILPLVGIGVNTIGQWPPTTLPETPLVIVANHPFGVGDGIATLSLAEQLGRPFRVMIASELLKIKEMEPYSLPVEFSGTKEALKNNLAVRHEAVRLLESGVTIVVFPAGGVATAPKGFGEAEDLPWKMFPARLIQDAKASVVPVYFSGQNGRLFHLVSRPRNLMEREGRLAKMVGKVSLTLRLSLLVREFVRLSGKTIGVRIGRTLHWRELEMLRDRKALLEELKRAVFELAAPKPRKPGAAFGGIIKLRREYSLINGLGAHSSRHLLEAGRLGSGSKGLRPGVFERRLNGKVGHVAQVDR
jgi:putative hemolysin